MEPRLKLHTYKSNVIDNMQHKHILLASKAKHSSTSQVKIRGYIKAKSSPQKIAPRWMMQKCGIFRLRNAEKW